MCLCFGFGKKYQPKSHESSSKGGLFEIVVILLGVVIDRFKFPFWILQPIIKSLILSHDFPISCQWYMGSKYGSISGHVKLPKSANPFCFQHTSKISTKPNKSRIILTYWQIFVLHWKNEYCDKKVSPTFLLFKKLIFFEKMQLLLFVCVMGFALQIRIFFISKNHFQFCFFFFPIKRSKLQV